MQTKPNRLTPLQAWEKMKTYCAYQERCQSEVFGKLREASLTALEADTIIARLIEENLLNEERFARSFARGHFNLKKWGKKKIEYALRQKQISPYCIKKAMEEIEEDAYDNTLLKLATAKWEAVKAGTPAQRWDKTRRYLLQKGFSPQDVLATLRNLQSPQ
ncbi:MAG TPA: regulatory protein RecX [Phnomibacter sp.]|nr:regulatory protein RecX [Phnomibacter sp.]